MTSRIAILGAGLAGLSAAFHLKENYDLFEMADRVGGLCKSESLDGYTFDYAIHILYSSDPYATQLIKDILLKDNFHIQNRSSWIYSKGVFTYYPFQANTYGLPADVIEECILGLIEAKYEKNPDNAKNFEEWTLATFGEGIAKYFMIPFNQKCWAIDLKKMSIGWIKDRVLQPELRETIRGALSDQRKGFGPNAEFWYPQYGGIESLPKGFLPYIDSTHLHLNTEIAKIQVNNKLLITTSGESIPYHKIISSLPLPKLIDLIDEKPESVIEARNQLENNTIWGINLGIDRPHISDKHWIYYPEAEYIFHRISFPMNFHSSMAPEGKSSITAEVATSKYKQLDLSSMVSTVIEDLQKTGFIKNSDEIVCHNVLELAPAYVIYHLEHRRDVDFLHAFLQENDILACGRFGEWEYLNMDVSIMSGKRLAERALQNS